MNAADISLVPISVTTCQKPFCVGIQKGLSSDRYYER